MPEMWTQVEMKTPPPQALHVDHDPPGGEDFMLLHGRMMTLKMHGIEAMSPHDIRNGYKPRDIIRLILGQLIAHYRTLEAEMKREGGGEWRDLLGTSRPSYMLEAEIRKLEKERDNINETMTEDAKQAGGTPLPTQPKDEATKILDLCISIRQAKQTIASQLRDLRKEAKQKINALSKAETALLDTVDEKQTYLFDLDPAVTEEVNAIIDNPEI